MWLSAKWLADASRQTKDLPKCGNFKGAWVKTFMTYIRIRFYQRSINKYKYNK